jgi:hypothetical protein
VGGVVVAWAVGGRAPAPPPPPPGWDDVKIVSFKLRSRARVMGCV